MTSTDRLLSAIKDTLWEEDPSLGFVAITESPTGQVVVKNASLLHEDNQECLKDLCQGLVGDEVAYVEGYVDEPTTMDVLVKTQVKEAAAKLHDMQAIAMFLVQNHKAPINLQGTYTEILDAVRQFLMANNINVAVLDSFGAPGTIK